MEQRISYFILLIVNIIYLALYLNNFIDLLKANLHPDGWRFAFYLIPILIVLIVMFVLNINKDDKNILILIAANAFFQSIAVANKPKAIVVWGCIVSITFSIIFLLKIISKRSL